MAAESKRVVVIRSENSSRNAGLLCEEGPRLPVTSFVDESVGEPCSMYNGIMGVDSIQFNPPLLDFSPHGEHLAASS